MSKPNLILLHGALGSKDELQPLKELLKDDFKTYTMNFEGHGGSSTEETLSMDLFAQNLIDFCDEYQIENTHIFGYSMGGYVALNTARQAPELVNTIITLGTKFAWSPEIAAKETKLLSPKKIEEKIPKYAGYLASLHGEVRWKKLMHQTAVLMNGLGGGKAFGKEEFSSISHKVYLGHGENDQMVTKEETKEIESYLPNATFYSLPKSEHPIVKVNKEILANKIKEILL